MTRLDSCDIRHIGGHWPKYEERLKALTGLRLWDLASRAAGAEKPVIDRPFVGVVSIGYGEGVISGFAEAAADICKHLGFPTVVAEAKNFAGWAEVMARGVEVVVCSDDDFFGAFNLRDGRVAENSQATGLIYAECLAAMAGGLEGRRVQLIGAGPVGLAGCRRLLRLGAEVFLHERDPEIFTKAQTLHTGIRKGVPEALAEGGLFLQAAPDPEALPWARMKLDESVVAHPAVPFTGPSDPALKIWHDPLELGLAAMLAFAVKS